MLWQHVCYQTNWSDSGHRLGLRMTDVLACLDELEANGDITDRKRALERVMILDAVACKVVTKQVQDKSGEAAQAAEEEDAEEAAS